MNLPNDLWGLIHLHHGANTVLVERTSPIKDAKVETKVGTKVETKVVAPNVYKWKVEKMSFEDDISLLAVDFIGDQVDCGTHGNQFAFCENLLRAPVHLLLAPDVGGMFCAAGSFNSDLSQWDTRNVTNIRTMFWDAHSFNSDLSQWDTGNVQDTSYMFLHASSFNSDLSQWDTRNVKYMQEMFDGATSFNSHKPQFKKQKVN